MLAAVHGQLSTVKRLLSLEANIELRNLKDETALLLAIKNRYSLDNKITYEFHIGIIWLLLSLKKDFPRNKVSLSQYV